MKLSNKILIGILGIVILFQFFAMVKFRGMLKKAMAYSDTIHMIDWQEIMDSDLVEKEFDHTGFSRLKIQFRGNVVIRQSDEYRITVKAPEKLLESDLFEISKSGKTLTVKSRTHRHSQTYLDVVIFMPGLKELKIAEEIDLKIDGFDEKDLEITLTGECAVIGEDLTINDLEIDGFGEISVDFKDCTVNDADVRSLGEGEYDLNVENLKVNAIGESDFNLNIRGGKITGTMIGEGNIYYNGDLKRENVSFLGPGKVRQR